MINFKQECHAALTADPILDFARRLHKLAVSSTSVVYEFKKPEFACLDDAKKNRLINLLRDLERGVLEA